MQLTESQKAVRDQFRRFMTAELGPRTEALESGAETPYPLMKRMIRELGLGGNAGRVGGEAPRAPGESAPDPELRALLRYAATQITVELARVNPGFGMSWGASVGLCAGNIRGKGTPAQVKKYVPSLMQGDTVGAWCLTEPGAGSDALGAMQTRARRDGDAYVLRGEKTFITNAPYADVFLIYAKNDEGSVQAFIVERAYPGVATSQPFKKMGMRSSPTGAVYLDDVRVPAENLLGGGTSDRDHVKKSLAGERVGIAAMSYGIAERSFEIALDYARTRVQGGHAIAHYQLIQERLARMYVALSNARRIVYGGDSRDEMTPLDAAAGKLYVAEIGTWVALEAIHILGGNGYMEEYVVERLARDAKLLELGGGTTEMQILTIARHLLAGGAAAGGGAR
jgi:hypothetical protein